MIRTTRLGLDDDEPRLDYHDGLARQLRAHAEVSAGRSPGELLLVQHASVYTAGTRTQPSDLPTDGSPVVEAGRGGRITWHGPGQLVAYPIVRLPDPLDVVAYVRGLEQCLVRVCRAVGVMAKLVDGRSGVWVAGRPPETGGIGADEKVAAIGIRVAEGVTMHGVAVNCDNPLDPYSVIMPCGIADAGVTTLSLATGRRVAPADVVDLLEDELTRYLDGLTSGALDSTLQTQPAGAHA